MEYWTAILLKPYKKEIINKNIYYQTQIIQFKHIRIYIQVLLLKYVKIILTLFFLKGRFPIHSCSL
jgi:hypothetical protein